MRGLVVHAELVENGPECVIVYNQEEAKVFAGRMHDLSAASGRPMPQSKRLYNSTLYPGAEY